MTVLKIISLSLLLILSLFLHIILISYQFAHPEKTHTQLVIDFWRGRHFIYWFGDK